MPRRVVTGTLYLFAWVLLAVVGGWPLTIVIAAMGVIGILELKWVASRRRVRLAPEAAYPIAVAFIVAAHHFANDLEQFGLATMALIVLLVLVTFGLHLQLGLRAPTACVSLTIFASIYCGLMLSALVLVRGYQPDLREPTAFGLWPMGQRLLFFLLCVTMISDVAAYVVGKSIGKRPLSETVSPNKTVEGCLGGLVGAVLAALIAGHLFNVGVSPSSTLLPEAARRASLGHQVVLGLLLGGFGQIGDFGASIFKREAEVKDYGWLFPGHGGVLDRLDTLMVNAPILYLYVHLAL